MRTGKCRRKRKNKEKTFIGGRSKPDMEQWNSRNRKITEEIKALASQKGTLEEQEKAQKEAAAQIDALTASGAELDRTYRVVGGLYDVIRGQETGINLERFVLGALLDDVTRKANIRLSVMSGGRYQLQRALGERADARKKAGLDLEVMDSYTGKARPASTLSGGETFLASLSLALGLADVVQEYAGGVRLDSMFIDEGFGSLDQETLDLRAEDTGRTAGTEPAYRYYFPRVRTGRTNYHPPSCRSHEKGKRGKVRDKQNFKLRQVLWQRKQ